MENGWKILSSGFFTAGFLVIAMNYYLFFSDPLEAAVIGFIIMIIGSLMYSGYRLRLVVVSFVFFIMFILWLRMTYSGGNSLEILIGTIVLAPIVILMTRKAKK